MDACDVLTLAGLEPDNLGRLVHEIEIPARAARTAQPTCDLHPETRERLAARGYSDLYSHQCAAIDALVGGQHVAVATGTASGKSLCYQVPIVDAVVRGERSTALLLFPTKALANDQLQSMRRWLVPGLKAVTYDGDTHSDDRTWARRNANVLLTNPEMLHMGILPSHDRWATFLMRLRYVVIDELHALRGVFGGHVAQLLRRLRRICDHYGANPTFCASSATIGNPAALAAALIGDDVIALDDDGSPSASRCFAVWERPVLDPHTGTRASAIVETAGLLAEFVRNDCQTIAFCRGRQGAELVAATARRHLVDLGDDRADRISAYRAGFRGDERRTIERALSDGSLLGVAATNALELGIDVGGLDAVVLNGFPGTLASMWQQVGRAGRSGRRSAAVLVVGDDQLDQWYARHPDELVHRPIEHAVVNPDNPFIARAHAECAAYELPLTPDDARWFGPTLDDTVVALSRAGRLVARNGKLWFAGHEPPARRVGLRSGSTVEYRLTDVETGHEVGTVDDARVYSVAHPGAVYLHQGRQYRVQDLREATHEAFVEEYDADEFTQARSDTDIEIVEVDATTDVAPGVVVHLGRVEVTSQVVAYQRKVASTRAVIDTVPLDLPARVLSTRACWYTIEPETMVDAGVTPAQVLGAVHATEHSLIGLLPLFAICDRWDVGGLSMAAHPQTECPTIFVYDGYPGGAGIADLAYDAYRRHLRETRALVRDCGCDDGCPSCVQSPKCGNWNEYLDKHAAELLLGVMQPSA